MNWIKVAAPDGKIEFLKAELINDIYYVSPDEISKVLLSKHGYKSVSNEIFSDSLKVIFVPYSNFTALVTADTTKLKQISTNPILKDSKLYLPLKELLEVFVSIKVIDAELVNDNLLVYESVILPDPIVKREEGNNKSIFPKKNSYRNDDQNPNFYRLPENLKRRNMREF